jgi:radical SAM-linked protein
MSHLEIARALEYAVRRSGLPFAISEGFSPHIKIAFGSALPVGVGSTCEIFDLQLTQYVPAARALEALQASSVADLMVTDVTYIENGAAAASVAYPRSSYIARFEFANFPGESGKRIRLTRRAGIR